MEEITLKITQWIDILNNRIEALIKDCDDNSFDFRRNFDKLTLVDIDGNMTIFENVKYMTSNLDIIDMNCLVHPVIYQYNSII